MEEKDSDLENDINRIQKILNRRSEHSYDEENSELSQDESFENDSDVESELIRDGAEYDDNWTSVFKNDGLEDNDFFDTTPTIENCYQHNLRYQYLIEESIRDLEMELIQNRDLQNVLRERLVKPDVEKINPKISWSTFCSPYFKNRSGHIPPPNDDVRIKAGHNECSLITQPLAWSSKEEETLIDAVKENAVEMALNPKEAKCAILKIEISSKKLDKGSREAKSRELEKVQEELEEIRKAYINEINLPREHDYDWMKISASCFEGNRSPIEIKLYWKNYLHPSINKKRWEKEEVENFKNIFKNCVFLDWDEIASKLGTHRTALQCCGKYNSKFAPIHKRFWTDDEKAKLHRVVEECRIGDFIPWKRVAESMEGRTQKQLWHHYNYVSNPSIKKGKWTMEEDMWLVAAVWLFGLNTFWNIRKYVTNRSSRQCLDRWGNTFDPRLRFGRWRKEEDRKILQLVEKFGKKWACIRSAFKGRSASMLSRRYKRLTKEYTPRASYNLASLHEYQNLVFRQVHFCLCKIAATKKIRKICEIPEFKKSFVSFFPGISETKYLVLRQTLLQLSLEEFHNLINPSVMELNSSHPSYVDHEIKTYLSFFHVATPKGRPSKIVKVDEKSEPYRQHLNGLKNTLKNGMVPLPPMLKTLMAFRSLLLLRNNVVDSRERVDGTLEPADMEQITSSESYGVLFQQFASLFFWPAVLSVLDPSENVQGKEQASTSSNVSTSKVVCKKRKRRRKKPSAPKPEPIRKYKKRKLDTDNIRRSSRLNHVISEK